MRSGLKRRTLENIGYNATSKIVALAFQAVASIILSRNLSSADYGVVGFAWIFINFLSQFNDLGLNNAVVHTRDLDDDGLATVFTLKFLISAALFVTAVSIAPAARWIFDDAAVVTIIRVLSFSFVLNAFTFVPSALLTRALDYRRLAVASTLGTFATAAISIVLVLLGFGYWSIVVANVAAGVVGVVVLNTLSPKRFVVRLDPARAREFIRYGWGLFASGLLIFAVFNTDNFIIGATRGSEQLGLYMIAFSWGSMVATLMVAGVHAVLFPTFARIQAERERIRGAYLLSFKYITALGVMVNATLFVVAPDFLIHVLGRGTTKWLPALDALRILCAYGVIRVMLEPLGNVIMAFGRTTLLMRATLVAAAIEVALLYPALRAFGIEGAAVVVTLAYLVQYGIYWKFLKSEVGVKLADLGRAIGPAMAPLLALAAVFVVFARRADDSTPAVFAVKLAACVVCYVVSYGLVTGWAVVADVRGLLGMSRSTSHDA